MIKIRKIFRIELLAFALVASILLAFLLFGMPKMSGDIRALYPRHAESLDSLNRLEQQFGETLIDYILIPIPDGDLSGAEEELLELEEQLQGIENLSGIHSPLKANGPVPIPLRLISPDRRWVRFLIEIPSTLTDGESHFLNEQLEVLRPKHSLRSGAFYASETATATLEKENAVRAPLCLIAIFSLLLAWTRSINLSVRILTPPLLAILLLALGLSLLHHPLGAIAQLVPPLMLAVGTSYASYLASRILSSESTEDALLGARASLTLAAGTTVIGFISLYWMECRGVDDFASIMTAGTVLSALLSWLLIPRLIRHASGHRAKRSLITPPRWLALPLTFLILLAGIGLSHLRVDTVPLDFFADGSAEKENLVQSEKVFPGSHVLSIGFTFPDGLNGESLDQLRSLERRLRAIPGVLHVFGAPEFSRLFSELKKRDLSSGTLLREYGPLSITSEDQRSTRIILETDHEGNALIELSQEIERLLAESSLPPSLLSSRELVIAGQSKALTHGLLESVLSALLIVWALLLISFRSLPISLLGLLPNILPIIGVFGALGYFTNSVNLGAAIVASCALGMISDFTFHLLFLWRSLGAARLKEAVERSVPPFVLTGLTLVVGFSPTILSPVSPVRSFGILLGGSLTLGITLNLTLLPWLLNRIFPTGEGKNLRK